MPHNCLLVQSKTNVNSNYRFLGKISLLKLLTKDMQHNLSKNTLFKKTLLAGDGKKILKKKSLMACVIFCLRIKKI